MNTKDFTQLVMKNGNYASQVEAKAAIAAISNSITQVLTNGDSIRLDIGTFKTALLKGKTGIVPGSKPVKKYTTVDKMVPKFGASAGLKTSVANGK